MAKLKTGTGLTSVPGASMVRLETYTADNSATLKSFNLSTYTDYGSFVFNFESLLPTTDNSYIIVRVGTTSSAITSGYMNGGWYKKSTGGSQTSATQNLSTSRIMTLGPFIGTASGETGVSGFLNIYNPFSSTYTTGMAISTSYLESDNAGMFESYGIYNTAVSTPYIFFAPDGSQNMVSGKIILYGIKNA